MAADIKASELGSLSKIDRNFAFEMLTSKTYLHRSRFAVYVQCNEGGDDASPKLMIRHSVHFTQFITFAHL